MENLIPVMIQGVVVDPASPFEAQSIAMEIENQKLPRPGTHDLIKNIIESLGCQVLRAAITNLKESTYYASLSIKTELGISEVDCRPSDAIAIALRAKAPVFVSTAILEQAGMDPSVPHENDKSKKLKDLQSRLNNLIEQENYEEAAKVRDAMEKVRAE